MDIRIEEKVKERGPKFYNTTKVEGHDHILYMKKDGTGISSEHKGHIHLAEVVRDEEGNPVLDGEGNPKILIGKAVALNELEVDAHMHEVKDEVQTKSKNKTEKEGLVEDVLKHFAANREVNSRFREKGYECEDMMIPDKQWSEADKAALAAEGKPALSLPFIATNVTTMLGIFKSQATDISVDPVENSDVAIQGAVNALLKYVSHKNKAMYHQRKAFEDQLIVGSGSLQARIDFSEDINGNIVIERVPWTDIDYGPHQLEDQSDMHTIVVSKFIPANTLKDMYPEHEREFDMMMETLTAPAHSQAIIKAPAVVKAMRSSIVENSDDDDVRKVRVMDLHKKVNRKVPLFIDENDRQHNLELFSRAAIAKIKTIPSVEVQEVIQKRIEITRVAGTTFLFSTLSPYSDFTIGSSYGLKRGNDLVSFVDMLIDRQRETNRLHSQVIHYSNTMLGAGFQSPAGSIKDKAKVKKIVSGYGGWIEYDPQKGPLQKIEQSNPPNALMQMIESEYTNMQRAANMQGLVPDTASTSGVLEGFRRKQALLGHEYQFANMRLLLERIGKVILEMMDIVYFKNPRRAARILLNSSIIKNETDFDVSAYTEETLIELLQRVDISDYDLLVSESPHSTTQRQLDLMLTMEMAANGSLPQEVVGPLFLELSPVGQIGSVKKVVKQARSESKDSADMTNKTEIVKSFTDDAQKLAIMQTWGMIEVPQVPQGQQLPEEGGGEQIPTQ